MRCPTFPCQSPEIPISEYCDSLGQFRSAKNLDSSDDQDHANDCQDQQILPDAWVRNAAFMEYGRQRIGEVVVGHEAGNRTGFLAENDQECKEQSGQQQTNPAPQGT